jgi:hypothetical protein
MTTTALALFDWQTKVLQPKNIPTLTDKDQLTPVLFELYPVEVLEAAQRALGAKALSDYSLEIYKFAITAKSKGLLVKASQLSGVLLTQKKLDKWLASTPPQTLHDTGVKREVFLAYAQYHQRRIAESEAVMDQLRVLAGVQ